MTCDICRSVLSDPVVTKCGHTYDRICLQVWFNQSDSCPLCQQTIAGLDQYYRQIPFDRSIATNYAVKHIISCLVIKCDLKCGQVFKFSQRLSHLKTCEKFICKECHQMVGDYNLHDSSVCFENFRKQLDQFRGLRSDVITLGSIKKILFFVGINEQDLRSIISLLATMQRGISSEMIDQNDLMFYRTVKHWMWSVVIDLAMK